MQSIQPYLTTVCQGADVARILNTKEFLVLRGGGEKWSSLIRSTVKFQIDMPLLA